MKINITNISNDLFTFAPWITDKTYGPKTDVTYKDLEQINQDILNKNGGDVCKVSFSILPSIIDDYIVLPIGNTLVKNTGPKIIANKKHKKISELSLLTPGKIAL